MDGSSVESDGVDDSGCVGGDGKRNSSGSCGGGEVARWLCSASVAAAGGQRSLQLHVGASKSLHCSAAPRPQAPLLHSASPPPPPSREPASGAVMIPLRCCCCQ